MTLIKLSNQMPGQKSSMLPVFNELFNELFENSISSDFRRWKMPAVNILNYNDRYEIHLAAPGLKKDDFKINIEGGNLTISVAKEAESKETMDLYSRKEFQFTSFIRNFTMPEDVNLDGINASYNNGIMLVILPKEAEAKVKSREIKLS